MKTFLVIFVVFSVLLGASSEDIDVRIAGGFDANIANYPYMLQVEYMSQFLCGGFLISLNYALTAANYVISKDIEYFLVRAGSAILYEGGQELTVNDILFHPKFENWTNNYGVAILVLSESVSVANAVPIPLATNDDAIIEGANLVIAGWGVQEFQYYVDFASNLQAAGIPILSDEICSSAYDIVSDVMFCAAYLLGEGYGFCYGDNGGPGVLDGVAVGVMSFGQGCGNGINAGVLIRVSKVKDWIDSVIGVS